MTKTTKKLKSIKEKKVGLDLLPELNDEIVEKYLLIKKIRNAVLDMMSKVKFDKKAHLYTRTDDGTWLQGVSEVSSIVPKDWLSAWGAKECSKFLGYSDYEGDTERAKEMMQKIIDLKTPEEFISLLKEAKGASFRKSKEALIDGKVGHEWLENYIKAKIRGKESPTMPTGTLERPLQQFLEWEKENITLWVLCEARVAYPEKGYAGTMDGMAIMKDGKLAVIDFKFSSHFSEDYELQTAGYQACFEPYEIPIDERIIVRLPKTIEREEWNEKERKYYKVPNDIEVKVLIGNYQEDRDTFFHCLPVKKWINKGRNNK